MSTEVTLPALGESVTEGTISRWLKNVGDTVEVDEPVVEVSTDKVDTEIPSPAAGVILEIKVPEDETAEVGAVLCIVGAEGEGGEPAHQAPAEQPATAASHEQHEDHGDDTASVAPVEQPDDSGEKQTTSSDLPQGEAASGVDVVLPQLGESVTEGTVSRWLKAVGDAVEADEPLLEVSTDKVDTEIPAPAAGTLLEIRVNEDEIAAVGAVLAVIGSQSAGQADEAPAAQPAEATEAETTEETPALSAHNDEAKRGSEDAVAKQTAVARRSAPAQAESDGLYVTPLVRKMAEEHGVELTSLVGTGVGGRIRKQDVLAAAEQKKAPAAASQPTPVAQPAGPAAKAPAAAKASSAPAASQSFAGKAGTTEKMSRLRQTIAKRMVESLQVAAQLTATVEVDMTAISRIRAQVKESFKQREGVGLSYLPFITKAAVEAMKEYAIINATVNEAESTVTYADAAHVGVAVDTPKGLLVPVIKDTGDYNIAGLARKIHDLAERTRTNKVTPDELAGGTFTITNYGSAGTLFDTPIINQPQVAILGTGTLVKRPVVMQDSNLGETIAVRDMMYLSLTYDHRVIDGAVAARFLSAVKARLQEGAFEAELGL